MHVCTYTFLVRRLTLTTKLTRKPYNEHVNKKLNLSSVYLITARAWSGNVPVLPIRQPAFDVATCFKSISILLFLIYILVYVFHQKPEYVY